MAILETLLAAGGGSITGAVGGVASAYFQMKLQEAQIPLRMAELEAKKFHAQQERQAIQAQEQGATTREEAKAQARTFEAAHESDRATYGNWLIDAIRGMVRPLITGWLVYLLSDMTFVLWELQDDNLDGEYWRELFRHLIVSWTYLTTTAVMYWFGSRSGRAPTLR